MKKLYLGLLVTSMVALNACSTTPTGQETGEESGMTKIDESAETSGAMATGTTTQGAADTLALREEVFTGHPLDNPKGVLYTKVIYFDYDSSVVPADVREILTAHAQYLTSNPNARAKLEGHADERGSREYNVGLGERRAHAVSQILTLQGAGGNQLSTVSYGEERPASLGHDDASWRLNRRVEIVYTNR